MGDTYRPNGHRPDSDYYRPRADRSSRDRYGNGPQYHGHPPLPRGPPPPMPLSPPRYAPMPQFQTPMHQFGRDDRHAAPEYTSRNDFSFRPRSDAPRYPDRPPSPRARPFERPDRRGMQRRGGNGPRRMQGRRYERVPTADRPLLRFQRGDTPEQLEGMNGDQTGDRFINLDEVSDSEELSMDQSESDVEPDETLVTKRRKIVSERASDPTKWSNPELYTSLPPVDDATESKRKDVVKLIRKARVQAAKEATDSQAVVDDFIGFDFDLSDEGGDPELPDTTPTGPKDLDPSHIGGSRYDVNPEHIRTDLNAIRPSVIYENSVASRLLAVGHKRKRDEDDVGELREPLQQRGRGKFGGGHVLEEWNLSADENSTPWIKSLAASVSNPGFRLHKEICDFYAFAQPLPFEQAMRDALLQRLHSFVQEHFGPSCSVHAFGSFAAGLYLPNADMDLVVISQKFRQDGYPVFAQSRGQMHKLANLLDRAGFSRKGSVEVIAMAKVPIIKFVDNATQLHVDLSFENDSGIIANQTFLRWKDQYPAMPALVTVIKQFLMMRGLNNNATGGLGGFSVTCLVVLLLANLPRVQLGEVSPELHMGEMLLEFLDFYGNQLDISRLAIRMDDPPGVVEKSYINITGVNGPNKASRLCIVDPNRPDNDISGGAKEVILIFQRFAEAREDIIRAMRDGATCLLPLQGNYNDFLWHRAQLRELHERTHGTGKLDGYSLYMNSVDDRTTDQLGPASEQSGMEFAQLNPTRPAPEGANGYFKPVCSTTAVKHDSEGVMERHLPELNDLKVMKAPTTGPASRRNFPKPRIEVKDMFADLMIDGQADVSGGFHSPAGHSPAATEASTAASVLRAVQSLASHLLYSNTHAAETTAASVELASPTAADSLLLSAQSSVPLQLRLDPLDTARAKQLRDLYPGAVTLPPSLTTEEYDWWKMKLQTCFAGRWAWAEKTKESFPGVTIPAIWTNSLGVLGAKSSKTGLRPLYRRRRDLPFTIQPFG